MCPPDSKDKNLPNKDKVSKISERLIYFSHDVELTPSPVHAQFNFTDKVLKFKTKRSFSKGEK